MGHSPRHPLLPPCGRVTAWACRGLACRFPRAHQEKAPERRVQTAHPSSEFGPQRDPLRPPSRLLQPGVRSLGSQSFKRLFRGRGIALGGRRPSRKRPVSSSYHDDDEFGQREVCLPSDSFTEAALLAGVASLPLKPDASHRRCARETGHRGTRGASVRCPAWGPVTKVTVSGQDRL